jgi:hypothetical protein
VRLSKLLIDQLGPICEIIRRQREDRMAVAECPNCKHDIQTPEIRLFTSNKVWKDFHCPYCRAKLKKKKQRWTELAAVPVSLLIAYGVPREYFRHVDIYIPLIALVLSFFTLSRPKLVVVSAPNNPADDLQQRQSQKLSESYSGRNLEPSSTGARDNSADLTFLRLR